VVESPTSGCRYETDAYERLVCKKKAADGAFVGFEAAAPRFRD
jgi:hypothetical protein